RNAVEGFDPRARIGSTGGVLPLPGRRLPGQTALRRPVLAEVHIDNVSKVYQGSQKGGVKAVDDITIHISDGEFIVLVGPSGCGKSTTLRMVAGLEEITEGTISIGGRIVNDVAPKDRDIAMVFQN